MLVADRQLIATSIGALDSVVHDQSRIPRVRARVVELVMNAASRLYADDHGHPGSSQRVRGAIRRENLHCNQRVSLQSRREDGVASLGFLRWWQRRRKRR